MSAELNIDKDSEEKNKRINAFCAELLRYHGTMGQWDQFYHNLIAEREEGILGFRYDLMQGIVNRSKGSSLTYFECAIIECTYLLGVMINSVSSEKNKDIVIDHAINSLKDFVKRYTDVCEFSNDFIEKF